MFITIVFPEFILSKAICDLRLALRELGEFDDYLRDDGYEMNWKRKGPETEEEWSWRVEYPQRTRWLYRILFLKPPQENDEERVPGQTNERTQAWTIVHSYFAQMGGLAYIDSHNGRYHVLTASKLTRRYRWTPHKTHPTKQLILGREDIEDKSKADLFVKSIAVLQIVRLVLNVIARAIKELPITQLEIATIAFAVMAILTYAINWGKPKDVSQPIRLLHTGSGGSRHSSQYSDEYADLMQSFMVRLRRPHKALIASRGIPDIPRVENDRVWMEGPTPLFYQLLGISSLLFGSLHCIAWNLEFPTRTELLCWRVANLLSAILPGLALSLSMAVGYLRTAYFVRKGTAILLECLQPLEFISEERWKCLLWPEFDKWDRGAFNAFLAMPKDRNTDWEVYPPHEIFEELKDSKRGIDGESAYVRFTYTLREFHQLWQTIQYGESHHLRFGERWLNVGKYLVNSFRDPCVEYDFQDFWRGYERSINRKPGIPPKQRRHPLSVEMIIRVYENEIQVLEPGLDLATKVVEGINWCGGMIYVACRLMTIVLLFTCLRAAPSDVYQVVKWTVYIPGIS